MTARLIVAGTGSRAWTSIDVAVAALQHASGGQPALLRIGDAFTGGDVLLKTAALRLGWPQPDVKRANWHAWCPGCYDQPGRKGHRRKNKKGTGTHCKDAGHLRNTVIVEEKPRPDRGVALFQARLPCAGTLDCATKMVNAGIPVTCWCSDCGIKPLGSPCRNHSLTWLLEEWDKRTSATPRLL